MRLPPLNRLVKEDVADAPAWGQKVVYILNLFMEQVINALNRKISLGDNVDCQVYTGKVIQGDFPLSVGLSPARKVQGVLLLQLAEDAASFTTLGAAPAVEWSQQTNDVVIIESAYGLAVGKTYNISVLIF